MLLSQVIDSVPALAQNQFTAIQPSNSQWLILEGRIQTNLLITLECSTNLVDWIWSAWLDYRVFQPNVWFEFATNDWFRFHEPWDTAQSGRFYRFALSAFTEANDWKNQVILPVDAFASEPPDAEESRVRWIKFAIRMDQPGRVYYQNSQKYVLHQDFAGVRWPEYANLNSEAFDRLTLFNANRQLLLGTVLIPPKADTREYGLQLSGRDPLPRELVLYAFTLVGSTILADPQTQAYYFPAFEQTETAAMDSAFFAAHGIRLSTVNRWLQGNQVYAPGWTLGHLRFIAAGEIDRAYAEGRLGPQDILLTDGVPAEVPVVAGILTTTAATPNSHVAILAGTYGIPFAFIAAPSEQERLRQLVGQEIVLQAVLQEGYGLVSTIRVEGNLSPELRTALLALKTTAPVKVQPMAWRGAYHASVDALWLDDVQYFGGKASQYGLLRRTIPSNTPPAIAFSFDLWNAFLDQNLPSGQSLRGEISNRLVGLAYPADLAILKDRLAVTRQQITKSAQFSASLKQVITNALRDFDPYRNIRFRSSSNAEDSQSFSAAGLYDSYSGCLADDLDGDDQGPSHADPTEPNERGVFRALQKVYASFYNDNAYLERLRHGIDEFQVGMAVLAHYSYPDDEEMANGVATVDERQAQFGGPYQVARLATQSGAVSVANPEGNAKPEVVEATSDGLLNLLQSSSLVPLGGHVLQWEDEYEQLAGLLFKVYRGYAANRPSADAATDLLLDFEYKKIRPGTLVVKQVRALPRPGETPVTPFLLNEPTSYWIYQREGISAFANHRLKCFATLQTFSGALTESNLAHGLYTDARIEFVQGTNRVELAGAPSSWPNAQHSVTLDARQGWVATDRWTYGNGSNQWIFQLVSTLPATRASSAPFVPQAEIRKRLNVAYPSPQPVYDAWQDQNATTTQEEIQLIMRPDLQTLRPADPLRFQGAGLDFEIRFLESTNAAGPNPGADKNAWGFYMAELSPWAHTRITGLLAEPIELTGYYSQAASPGHKNLETWYLFEPRRDPNVPAEQLLELERRDIRLIYLSYRIIGKVVTVKFMGADGKFRSPP